MKRTIERIVAFAIRVADPERIILFGSMARETNDTYSDMDVLIVTEDDFQNEQIGERVRACARELALMADVLVCSKADLERRLQQPHSFLSGVLQEGKVVYEKETLRR